MHRPVVPHIQLLIPLLTCLVGQASFADSNQVLCPDMSDHQNVLDQAMKYYSENRPPRKATNANEQPSSRANKSAEAPRWPVGDSSLSERRIKQDVEGESAYYWPKSRNVYSIICEARTYEAKGWYGYAVKDYTYALQARRNNVSIDTDKLVLLKDDSAIREGTKDLQRAQSFENVFLRTSEIQPSLADFNNMVDNVASSSNLDLALKLTLLQRVKSELGRTMKTDGADPLTARVDRLLNVCKREIQCLTMSTQLSDMADKLKSIKAYDKAEQLYLRVISISEKNLGPDNPETIAKNIKIAELFLAQGRKQEAQAMYERTLNRLRKLPDPGSNFGYMLEDYAQFLTARGQPDKATRIYDEARAFYAKSDFSPNPISKMPYGAPYLGR